jgi:hypothetical protein
MNSSRLLGSRHVSSDHVRTFHTGQPVLVQYGTHDLEDWFPAVFHLLNPDSSYVISYNDLDESDPTAAHTVPERIKAVCDCDCNDDTYYYRGDDHADHDYEKDDEVHKRPPQESHCGPQIY